MRISLVLRAVATSWVAVIANASVGIFLTPYVLHRLGDEAFGVWVLTTNLVGYYGILDAGVRSAILRYVSKHKELNDEKSGADAGIQNPVVADQVRGKDPDAKGLIAQ